MHRRHGNGALAQLGERLLCKHQVIGSIPISSTICLSANGLLIGCPPHKRRRPFGLFDGLRAGLRTFGSLERRSDGSSQDFPEMKSSGLPLQRWGGDMARKAGLFDIVNGFFNRCRGAAPVDGGDRKILKIDRCS